MAIDLVEEGIGHPDPPGPAQQAIRARRRL